MEWCNAPSPAFPHPSPCPKSREGAIPFSHIGRRVRDEGLYEK